jgi:copper(I)-binding protein
MQALPSRLFAVVLAAFGGLAAGNAVHAQEIRAGALTISQPWSRATPPGSKIGVGYLTIQNTGKDADKLVSATSPASTKVEIHEMAMNKGVMTMRPVKGGVPIAPGQSVTFQPGGFHMMFMGLKAPLKQGATLPATLVFEKAGKVEVAFPIESVGASKPMTMPMHH